jgi:hypothetical protein
MKTPSYFGLLVFSLLAVSALAEGDLSQVIQMDTSKAIAVRSRIEKLAPATAPRKSPPPGFIALPSEKKLYLYDVVLIENGLETTLETVEKIRSGDAQQGLYPRFALLAASFPDSGQLVYVYSTDGKFYVNTAKSGQDGKFRKVSGELVAEGIKWEKARLKKEDGILRLYIEGDARLPKVFEQQESGSFLLKSG